MDESRKRTVSSDNAKNMSSSLDEDFGNDILSSWKLPTSGDDAIDFNVESVPKGSKNFSFGSLDDFRLDGAFDKLSSFEMGMSGLDFSSPVKKKVKHNSSSGDDPSEGRKDAEKDFSFSFDFNELGKFNLDAKLGIEEESMSTVTGKINPISTEGNKDTQRYLSTKCTDTCEDKKSKEQTQTNDTCTLRPRPTRQESVQNGNSLTLNVHAADSSGKMQEHTSVNPARMEKTNLGLVSNGRHRVHSNEAYPSKAAVNLSSQNVSCCPVSVEDPAQEPADPVNSKGPNVDFIKVHMSRKGNDNEQSVSSQSRSTSTVNPYISRRSLSELDSRNEEVRMSRKGNDNEQSVSSRSRNTSTLNPYIPRKPVSQLDSQNEEVHMSRKGNANEQSVSSRSRNTSTVNPYISRSVSQLDSQNEVTEGGQSKSFSSTSKSPTKKSTRTKDSEEGTSAPKSISSSMQREIRNVKPSQTNEAGTFSLLSKSAVIKSNRIELTSETLKKSEGENTLLNKMATHPTDLKREHKQANAGIDKSKTALSETYIKPAIHGLLTTSMNVNDAKNARLGLERPSAGDLSQLNTRSSTAPSTGYKIVPNNVLLKSNDASDSMQVTPSKDDKIPEISLLTERRTTKLGLRSANSGILLEMESVEASGGKVFPIPTSKIPNFIPKGKSALLGTSIMQKESVLDPKAPPVVKHIMRSPAARKSPQSVPELGNQTILGCGSPKARMDNEISQVLPFEMRDISDLELPALFENDGNVEKAEACRKELEDMCTLLKRKHAEAKELQVRNIVNNNMTLMLNNPMFDEKICSLQKFANSLRSKYLFEEVGTFHDH